MFVPGLVFGKLVTMGLLVLTLVVYYTADLSDTCQVVMPVAIRPKSSNSQQATCAGPINSIGASIPDYNVDHGSCFSSNGSSKMDR